MTVQLYHGDCLEVMARMGPNSVDSIVTDPPAGIAFMGKSWDKDHGGRDAWIANMATIAAECLRVLKPGGHALVWALPRTSHWTATAWENAGFEVRDRVAHVFGSGFPKSHDVSKAIDKAAGAENVIATKPDRWTGKGNSLNFSTDRSQEKCKITAPATPEALQWAGWGTALKPAMEDWWLLRKPLAAGTVAANVLAWGTGAINVDGCRIGTDDGEPPYTDRPQGVSSPDWVARGGMFREDRKGRTSTGSPSGRWPANVVHDGSDEVLAGFPVTTSVPFSRRGGTGNVWSGPITEQYGELGYTDTGSAARFFYCAKASRADRDEGLDGLPLRGKNEVYGDGLNTATKLDPALHTAESVAAWPQRHNHHPTVKPTDLMRWLVRLVTRPGGVVLDPFMGSGSTGKAAVLEGMRFIGIEQDAEYLEIARRRIGAARLPLFAEVTA